MKKRATPCSEHGGQGKEGRGGRQHCNKKGLKKAEEGAGGGSKVPTAIEAAGEVEEEAGGAAIQMVR